MSDITVNGGVNLFSCANYYQFSDFVDNEFNNSLEIEFILQVLFCSVNTPPPVIAYFVRVHENHFEASLSLKGPSSQMVAPFLNTKEDV